MTLYTCVKNAEQTRERGLNEFCNGDFSARNFLTKNSYDTIVRASRTVPLFGTVLRGRFILTNIHHNPLVVAKISMNMNNNNEEHQAQHLQEMSSPNNNTKANHDQLSTATRSTTSECYTPESQYIRGCGDGWFSGILSMLPICAAPGGTQKMEQAIICEPDGDVEGRADNGRASSPNNHTLEVKKQLYDLSYHSKGSYKSNRNEQDEIVRELLDEADHREGVTQSPCRQTQIRDEVVICVDEQDGFRVEIPYHPPLQRHCSSNISNHGEALLFSEDMISIGRHSNYEPYPDLVSTPSRSKRSYSGFSYSVMSVEDKIVTSIADIMGCNAPLDESEFIDEDKDDDIPQPPPLNSLTFDTNWNDVSIDSDLTDNSFMYDLPPPPPPKSRGVFEVMLDTFGDKNICTATGKRLQQKSKKATEG